MQCCNTKPVESSFIQVCGVNMKRKQCRALQISSIVLGILCLAAAAYYFNPPLSSSPLSGFLIVTGFACLILGIASLAIHQRQSDKKKLWEMRF